MSTLNDSMSKKEFKRARMRHRLAYPTPLFKLFTVCLNFIAVPLASMLVTKNPAFFNLIFFAVAIIGSLVALYGVGMKPEEDNLKQRQLLIGVSTGLGFTLLVGLSLLVLTSY